MAVDKNKLAAIISGRARELCSPQGDKLIKESSRNLKNNNISDCEDYYSSRETSERYNKHTNDIVYSNESARNSSIPENIKQSMLNERIDMTGVESLSILDTMGIAEIERKPVREVNVPQQIQTTPQYVNTGIDYSIIKAIINECLNEHFSKQMISENTTLQTIGLKEGNISLVDNKGNIYRAKLEKIGNKNDKK
jgi:hypothetical protein